MLKSRLNYTYGVPLFAGFSLSFLDLREFYMYVFPPWGLGGNIEGIRVQKNAPSVKSKTRNSTLWITFGGVGELKDE